jgi:hypothetical protein
VAPSSGVNSGLSYQIRIWDGVTLIKKFLATAVWLHDTTGRDRITTGEVAKALKNASQIRLTNASDALNQNVGKGYAEKDGDSGFFVTEPGRTSLGL